MMTKHFDAVTTDDDVSSSGQKCKAGKWAMFVKGTFGSGTVTMEFSPDGGTTWATTGAAKTADGMASADVPSGMLRLTLTGATSPNLNAWIGPVSLN